MLLSRPLLLSGLTTVNVLPTDVRSASTKLAQEMTGPLVPGRLLMMLSVMSPGPWLPKAIATTSAG